MATKKNNTIYYLIGALLLGGAGFFIYRKMKDKDEPITPPGPAPLPPGPAPLPPKPSPSGPSPASSAKITELQNLMIKRYEQLNRKTEYNANDAFNPPGWGNKSTNALKYLQPTNFASRGIPNANNIDAYITSIKKDVETAAKEVQQQQTKQQTQTDLIALANSMEKHLNAKPGKNKIKLLADAKAYAFQWDNARKRYVLLDTFKNFSKGNTFVAKDIVNRGNGTLGIKYSDGKRYFIPASTFIAIS